MTLDQVLQELTDICRVMGADVRYCPEHRYLTALVWENEGERQARFIQQEIQRQTAMRPELVCYCFDLFSTLVYAI